MEQATWCEACAATGSYEDPFVPDWSLGLYGIFLIL